jgi:hypothetical protein
VAAEVLQLLLLLRRQDLLQAGVDLGLQLGDLLLLSVRKLKRLLNEGRQRLTGLRRPTGSSTAAGSPEAGST